MRRFLINLDRSHDRLRRMEQEFRGIGLDFTRVAGVDGDAIPPDTILEFARERPGLPWNAAQVGVFLAHLAVWKAIADGDDPVAAVFEDDVHLARDIAPLLTSDAWIPSDADLVRLEGMGNMKLGRGRKIADCPGRRLHRAHSRAWGSAGYVVTRRTAAVLSASPPLHHLYVDHFLFSPGVSPVAAKLNRYQVVPSVCVQDQVAPTSSRIGLESLVAPGLHPALPKQKRPSLISVLRPVAKMTVAFRP